MLICVTGGTGFVGAHSVAALVRAGHRVRLLVRDRSRLEPAMAALHIDLAAVDVVPGDVTDEAAVSGGVRGTDAVLHAASVFSFDSRRHAEITRTAVRGTEVVLAAALRSVSGPVVYVSSYGALLPARSRVVDTDSPVGRPRETYLASKADAELVARRYQADGAPVLITYPPALLGPDDVRLGDQNARLRNMLRGLMPIWPTGGLPTGDVRDTAALHAALFDTALFDTALFDGRAGRGNRFFGPGHYLTTRDYVRAVRAATGRALPTAFLPARAMMPLGMLTGVIQHWWPWHIPAEYGAIYTCACATRIDERADTCGIAARPVSETMTDTVSWMLRTGLVSARQAGSAHAEVNRPAVQRSSR
jgi:nucleoside-diphosphate-sugar epimerase